MDKYIDKAISLFNDRYNCAQSIVLAYADALKLDKDLAFKIAQGFEGGMAKTGRTCGTINAAIMLIGLKYSGRSPADQENKLLVREKTKAFLDDFMEIHTKGINCIDILREEMGKTYTMHSLKCARTITEVCNLLNKYLEL